MNEGTCRISIDLFAICGYRSFAGQLMAERCARFTGVVKLLCRRTYSTSLPVQITCYRSQLLTSKQQPRHRACTTAATAYDAVVESLEEKGVVNSLSTESVRRLSRICYGPKIVVAALMRYKEIYRDLLVPTHHSHLER